MQAISNTWKSLAAMDGVYVESKAVVNGVEYTNIEPPVITRALMQNGLEVGNVVSAVCQFELDTSASIPKSAEVQIKTRLVGYTNDTPIYSEWLPQGTFYVSKRINDPRISVQRFECYDALLKTNAVWEPASSVWPQTASGVVAEILGNIGLQLDSRTTIAQYSIGEPSAGTTMRDVLGIIAQQNGGNWIVTPENKLRLVPVVDLSESESADVIIDVDAVINEYYTGEIETITGVRFAVEDENDTIIGDDTGAVVSLTVPGIIAADVAELLIGKTYRPFSYGKAYYDIAAELGDYIQCEDAVSVIYAETVTLGTGMHGDISAPDLAEIVDEYPYVGSSDKTLVAAKAYAVVVADAARDAAIDAAAAELAEAVVDINSDIEDLQDQIDGNITTWFYAVNPTLNNPPANAWTTDAEKNNHLGDLYYNTENGYCWRFMLANGQYSWQRISDTDITTALANAQRAQDTADGKRRVFVVQPTPPYDVGDLWVQGTSGDIMRCSTAKATGAAYSQSDWVRASKYTDDTAVNTLNNSLTQQEIFNRLTDNGAAQGMVLYNGQLYINASYINAGTLSAARIGANSIAVEKLTGSIIGGLNNSWVLNLTNGTLTIGNISATNIITGTMSAARIKGDTLTLGGANNVNGVLRVLDASGNVVVTLNNAGADITDGSVVTYSDDRKRRVLLSEGIVAFQYYNDVSQPLGWIDVFKMAVDDAFNARIYTYKYGGGGNLDISGSGEVSISNLEETLDDAWAKIDLDDDSIVMSVRSGIGTFERASIQLTPDSFRMSHRDPLTGDTSDVFELVPGGASNTPLDIGSGGTGATNAAGARANLGAVANTDIINIAHGGTNATTPEDAQTNLEIFYWLGTATWSDVYSKLSKISGAHSAFVWLGASAVGSLLTGGQSDLAYIPGIVTSTGSNSTYRFFLFKDGKTYSFSVANLSATGGTPGTVYVNGRMTNTVTGTPDSNGNMSLRIASPDHNIVVSAKAPGVIVTPWVNSQESAWYARVTDRLSGAAYTSEVTVTAYYQTV